jgi:nitroreductase
MNIRESIDKRRAYRSLEKVEITDDAIQDLAGLAGMAPSCFNKQPWRFVFVRDTEQLQKLFDAVSEGNRWTRNASMFIAVFSQPDLDCIIKERKYFLLDTGMALGFLILRATEMGLVAHPIAGFDEGLVKKILEIPDEMQLITLVIVGKKSEILSPLLNDKQAKLEQQRPPRLAINTIAFIDRYSGDSG